MAQCVDCLRKNRELADKEDCIKLLEEQVGLEPHFDEDKGVVLERCLGDSRRNDPPIPLIIRFFCKLGWHPWGDPILIDGQYYSVCPYCEAKWGPW